MKKFFTVGEAANECGLTAETLRHYDRIGLVSPQTKDKFTGYRYYNADDLVRLRTIKMLKTMAIPLEEIKRLLSLNDLKQVTEAFSCFEEQARQKIKQLNEGLDYMRRVRALYEKLCAEKEYSDGEVYTQNFTERKFLLAPPEAKLCAANLWRYHDLFYNFLGDKAKLFCFTEKAAVITIDGESRLAAECVKCDESDERVITLPAGDYLCATGSDSDNAYTAVKNYAGNNGIKLSSLHADEIIINGILCWKYCVQVPITK